MVLVITPIPALQPYRCKYRLNYSGGIASGFTYQGVGYGYQPEVTFVFYHTRGTTTPIPASGDYKVLGHQDKYLLTPRVLIVQMLCLN